VQSINKKNEWDLFFSLHSKGQWWLTPFGYSTTELPPENDDILAAANFGADAIRNYNGFDSLINNQAYTVLNIIF